MPKKMTFTHLWGTGDSLTLRLSAWQCTSTHRLQDGWDFGSGDAWFHAPCCL